MAHRAASHVALHICSDSKIKCLKSQQEKKQQKEIQLKRHKEETSRPSGMC